MLRGGGAIAGFCNLQKRPTYDYEVLLLPSHRSVLVPFLPKQLIGVRLKRRNSSGPRSSIVSLTRWPDLWMDGWCGRHNVHNHHYIRSVHIARPRHYADQCRYYNLQCWFISNNFKILKDSEGNISDNRSPKAWLVGWCPFPRSPLHQPGHCRADLYSGHHNLGHHSHCHHLSGEYR